MNVLTQLSQILSTGYKSNLNLRPCDYQYNYSREELKELDKCRKDPVYFIENYVKITDVAGNIILPKLHDYQKRAIKTYLSEKMTIVMQPRQTAKCVCINTPITIRNKEYYDGKPFTINIGDFYTWQYVMREAERILKEAVEKHEPRDENKDIPPLV